MYTTQGRVCETTGGCRVTRAAFGPTLYAMIQLITSSQHFESGPRPRASPSAVAHATRHSDTLSSSLRPTRGLLR